MTQAANLTFAGSQAINSDFTLDTTQRAIMGTIISANDPYWGGGEYIYVRYAGTVSQFGLVAITPVFDAGNGRWRWDAVNAPNTANLGTALGIAMVGGTIGSYAWVKIAGLVPVNSTSSIAIATPFGVVAAGQAGVLAAGKQILGAVIAGAATITSAKTLCFAQNGSTALTVPNANGWFIGAYLSGTGIAAGTTVTAISPDGRTVTLSAATTAQVNGTVTATYNNGTVFYNVAYVNRPSVQGQIV
jgi:hypothetical protein